MLGRRFPSRLGNISAELKPTRKIIREVRARWPDLFVVAFKAETVGSLRELGRRGEAYLPESKVDMVVANNVSGGAPFGSDYNEVLIVTKERTVHLARDLKVNLVRRLLDEVCSRARQKRRAKGEERGRLSVGQSASSL